MTGEFGSTTIKKILGDITLKKYVLPAIQRPFVWKHEQVEQLFDSIMRGYPIGTFMFWNLKKKSINDELIKIYEFIKDVNEDEELVNPDIAAKTYPSDAYAVIDGQQRLTALYVGLSGTFAYYKKYAKRSGVCPKRKLYLDIANELAEDNDPKSYNFKFLTAEEKESDSNHHWFKVEDIIPFDEDDVESYLDETHCENRNILRTLWRSICSHKNISYYEEESQDSDRVLDIFIRANSGGTPLYKSDLLMAMIAHLWEIDIREEMTDLIGDVAEYGSSENRFKIDRDFVLKTCLVLHSNDVRSILSNFNRENISKFEENWERTKNAIKAAFKFLQNLGFDNKSIQAKGAVITLTYYIFYNGLEDKINKGTFDPTGENRKNIVTWLVRVFINGIYGGAPDTTHAKMRNILRENPGEEFPYNAMLEAYRSEGNNLDVTEDVLKDRLHSPFNSDRARYMLVLLYQGRSMAPVHADHLHPQSLYKSKEYTKILPKEDQEFFKNTYDTVLNLQLLESSINESKGDTPLTEWMKKNDIKPGDIYLSEGTSTDFKDYRAFIADRQKNMLSKLKTIMGIE